MSTTDTARTAKEQLLVSNSIDQALDKVDFRPFSGQAVYLDEKYLDCVDKKYLVASIRHRAFSAGAQLVDKRDHADIVLEVRSGGVGTDNSTMFLGLPEINVPGPVPVSLPEVRLFSRSSQTGTAKIGLVAYDARTGDPWGEGGVTTARSDDNNWFLLGIGPYRNGSVHNELNQSLKLGGKKSELPDYVAFDAGGRTSRDSARVRLTSESEKTSGGLR
jgi:hypothetical protein